MMIKTTEEQISELSHKMPVYVLQDVDKRISDWISMGGSHEDAYIQQQLRYMQHVANLMEVRG